jgi:hypothetical protein
LPVLGYCFSSIVSSKSSLNGSPETQSRRRFGSLSSQWAAAGVSQFFSDSL